MQDPTTPQSETVTAATYAIEVTEREAGYTRDGAHAPSWKRMPRSTS